MILMEVAFFAQFVPRRLCLLGLNFGLFQFFTHLLNFKRESRVLVSNISNKTNAIILKDPLFLQLIPLLLESVHTFLHAKAL